MNHDVDDSFWQRTDRGVLLTVQLSPRASRTEIVGVVNGALKVRVNAPPVDDKANEALIRLIAERLRVPRSSVSVIRGNKSRSKTLAIEGRELSIEQLLGPSCS